VTIMPKIPYRIQFSNNFSDDKTVPWRFLQNHKIGVINETNNIALSLHRSKRSVKNLRVSSDPQELIDI